MAVREVVWCLESFAAAAAMFCIFVIESVKVQSSLTPSLFETSIGFYVTEAPSFTKRPSNR